MNGNRRKVLKRAGTSGALLAALATGLLKPVALCAAPRNRSAFEARTTAEAMKLLGLAPVADSKDVQIKAPDIAENGLVVQLEISSLIPGTDSIALFVDKNPFPYVGTFDFSKGAEPFVALRVKLAETSYVRAVAAAGGRFYSAHREVKVTIGGCVG